jgi:ABC-type multidrug transport system ATPase subunit
VTCWQVDVHNPLMTVKETFQFAVDNFSVDPNTVPDAKPNAELKTLHEQKAEKMIELLGLGECRDTILGNALLRGVSGGQKKRVTVGEALLSEARVFCLDEVTNGLDSSTVRTALHSLLTSHSCSFFRLAPLC